MKLPPHPDTDDAEPPRKPGSSMSVGGWLVVAVLVILFVTIVLLHLTGLVGPAAH